MSQTRLGSFVEAWVNVFIGYGINFAMNLVILNGIFHKDITLAENVVIGILFTVVSVVRSYTIRRWFNGYIHRFSERISA